MPFIINRIPDADLSTAERKEIWKGFMENFQHHSGYSIFYPDDLRKCDNFLKSAQEIEWWKHEVFFKDKDRVETWHGYEYKMLQADMANLAKFIWLRRDHYYECADYLSVLWREKKEKLKSIVGLLYLRSYLNGEKNYEFSQAICERLLTLKMGEDWPMNLMEAHPKAYDYGLIEDINDFFAWEFTAYFDSFLSNAVRVFKGNLPGLNEEDGQASEEGTDGPKLAPSGSNEVEVTP